MSLDYIVIMGLPPLHILYICQYFPPEMGAPAARAYEFSTRWVKAGHRVTVICGIPNHPTGVVQPGYRRQWRKKEIIDGVEVHRMWVYVTPNSGTLKRSLNYLSFGVTAVLGALRLRHVDVCIASTPQFFAGLAGTVLRTLKRLPLLLEVRDLWPDSIEAVQVHKGGVVISLLRRVERFMYRSADRIVVVSPAFRAHIEGTNIPPESIRVVPNGVNTALFAPAQRGDRRVLHDLDGRFIVAYIGTHGLAHALETAVDAATLLQDQSDIHFLFAGEGARKAALKEYAGDAQNITFLDQLPRSEIAVLLGEIDVALVLLRDTPLFATVIPSKMFEIMGTGVPMILGVRGQACDILHEAGAGIAIEPENARQLADAVLRLRDDPAFAAQCGKNAFLHVRKQYDLDQLARNYLDIIASMP
ncbi:MAG: glycosyltransferase family 4 protein [Bacteroidia bacterium]|nr:glycosyltransferase family 4 protein [Bacteroidia bacterium]